MLVKNPGVNNRRVKSGMQRTVHFVVVSRDDARLFAIVPTGYAWLEFSEPLLFGHSIHVFSVAESHIVEFEQLMADKSAVIRYHRCNEVCYV